MPYSRSERPEEERESSSGLEPSGRGKLPWALVTILQLIQEIKLKEQVRIKNNVPADRGAGFACSRAVAGYSGRIIRWRVTAVSIAGTRLKNGLRGRPVISTGKPPTGSRSAGHKTGDIECDERSGRSKKPMS